MKRGLFFIFFLGTLIAMITPVSQAGAAEFHVTNATELHDALLTAQNNQQADIIYLSAGTYPGNFSYVPPKSGDKSLTLTHEPGVRADEIIVDGQNQESAFYLFDWTETGVSDVRINGMTVQNGNSPGHGGGINAMLACYNLSVTNCIIKNNRAQRYGGGLNLLTSLPGGGTITLENNLILDNTVAELQGKSRGGGARMTCWYGNYIVTNNVIAWNSAEGTAPQGGGLWISWDSNNVAFLIHNTIYGNRADTGGGVYFGDVGTANVYNNILWGNIGAEGGDIYFGNVSNRVAYHNNYSDASALWTVSEDNLNTDPLFLDAVEGDFHLQPISAMVNAGTSTVPDPPGLPLTDREGVPRTLGGAPDIGAYESSQVNPWEGTIGTEITILGSQFGTKKGAALVGKVPLKVLEWSEGSARCLLSRKLSSGIYDITLKPRGTPIVFTDAFIVQAPQIDSIQPATGSAGEEIVIRGFFFGTTKGKVSLDRKNCKVVDWTMDKETGESVIQFVVPGGLTPWAHGLKVTNGMGSATAQFNLE